MKKILLRLDLNVPLAKGRILNDYKLKRSLPSIQSLRRRGAVIVVSHLDKDASLKSVAQWLTRRLKKTVALITGDWPAIEKQVQKLKKGDIALLENIRLFPGETENDPTLARRLAGLADSYVNDAFAVSHRNHASVSAIKRYLPATAGPLLKEEVKQLKKIRRARKPIIVVIGGAKISTKLPLIKAFANRALVLVGGDIANILLREKRRGKKISPSVILPEDTVDYRGKAYDIGPKTIKLYQRYIHKAKTVIWNGPMGVIEKKGFEKGTKAIAQAIMRATKRGALTIVGGGETVSALSKDHKNFSWVSTGGGATLAFLENKAMPGLKGLIKR